MTRLKVLLSAVVLAWLVIAFGSQAATLTVPPSFSQVKSTGSTTPRILADRFAETINVKDFGAKGDGLADDTTAIQAAVNYAAIQSHHVWAPGGTYIVSASIKVPSYVAFSGSGIGATIFKVKTKTYTINPSGYWPGVFENADHTNGNVYIMFENLTVDGSKSELSTFDGGSGTAGLMNGFVLGGAAGHSNVGIIIHDVEIRNVRQKDGVANGFGVIAPFNDWLLIDRCVVHDNDGDGIDIYYGSTNCTVSNSIFWSNVYFSIESEGRYDAGWVTNRNHNISFVNNHSKASRACDFGFLATDGFVFVGNTAGDSGASGYRRGVQAIGSTNGTINGNAISGAIEGIYVGNDDTFGVKGGNRNITVSGNSVSSCSYGIHLFQDNVGINDNIVISGNTIKDAATRAILVEQGIHRATISNNSIYGGFCGIYITDGGATSGPLFVNGNVIDSCTSYGILVGGQIGTRVTNNIVRSAGDNPIWIYNAGTTSPTANEVSANVVTGTVGASSIIVDTHTSVRLMDNVTDKKISVTLGASDAVRGNTGLVSRASGVTGAIATGTTVTHGLAGTPAVVTLTAADGTPTSIYPSALGTTTFTINYTGGGTHMFYWTAKLAADQ